MNNINSEPSLKKVHSAAQWIPRYFDIVAIIFITTLLVSNIAAVKLFKLGPMVLSAGIIVFPLSYIAGDILTEVYGYRRTRRIIWMGLFANIFMVVVLTVATALPPAPNWHFQKQFALIHGVVPRIVVGSIIGYWAGEMLNSFIMSKMKIWTKGRYLGFRTIGSTLAGQGVDTVLFVSISYAGILPTNILVSAIISAWLFKCCYEALVTPVTYLVVSRLKQLEGVDQFDIDDKHNPFGISV